MKKRVLSLFLALSLLLCGCVTSGGGPSTPEETNPPTSTQTEPSGTLTLTEPTDEPTPTEPEETDPPASTQTEPSGTLTSTEPTDEPTPTEPSVTTEPTEPVYIFGSNLDILGTWTYSSKYVLGNLQPVTDDKATFIFAADGLGYIVEEGVVSTTAWKYVEDAEGASCVIECEDGWNGLEHFTLRYITDSSSDDYHKLVFNYSDGKIRVSWEKTSDCTDPPEQVSACAHDFVLVAQGDVQTQYAGEKKYTCSLCGEVKYGYYGKYGDYDFQAIADAVGDYAREKGFLVIYSTEESNRVKKYDQMFFNVELSKGQETLIQHGKELIDYYCHDVDNEMVYNKTSDHVLWVVVSYHKNMSMGSGFFHVTVYGECMVSLL